MDQCGTVLNFNSEEKKYDTSNLYEGIVTNKTYENLVTVKAHKMKII